MVASFDKLGRFDQGNVQNVSNSLLLRVINLINTSQGGGGGGLVFQNKPFGPRSLLKRRIYDLIVRLRTSRTSQFPQAVDH